MVQVRELDILMLHGCSPYDVTYLTPPPWRLVGMLLNRKAFLKMGGALHEGKMPIGHVGVPNDVHMHRWAWRLGIKMDHSPLFWDNAIAADARQLAHALGFHYTANGKHYISDDYPLDGYTARDSHGTFGFPQERAILPILWKLKPQLLSSIILHRVPAPAMEFLQSQVEILLGERMRTSMQRMRENHCPHKSRPTTPSTRAITILQAWHNADHSNRTPAHIEQLFCRNRAYAQDFGYKHMVSTERLLRDNTSAPWEKIALLMLALTGELPIHSALVRSTAAAAAVVTRLRNDINVHTSTTTVVRPSLLVALDADAQILDYTRPLEQLVENCADTAELIMPSDVNLEVSWPGGIRACCNKTCRCRVNTGLMIVRPGGSQGHDFGNQSSSWVAQLLSQLLHNETCRNYWSGRQWEQDCLHKLLGDTHLPSVSRLLHEGAAQWKPVTGPSGKVCVLPAAAVMPWVNRIMPSSSSAASIAIPSPEIMTNALRSTWTLNQPLPFAAHLLEVCSPSVCGDKVELAKLLEGAPVNSLAPTFRRCNLPLFYRNGSLQLGSTAS